MEIWPEKMRARTKRFALDVIRLSRMLPRTEVGRVLERQFLRSGTSVGSNYRSVCRARSKADFIAKMGLVLEEADETLFWLELIEEAACLTQAQCAALHKEADELTAIFTAALNTSKRRDEN